MLMTLLVLEKESLPNEMRKQEKRWLTTLDSSTMSAKRRSTHRTSLPETSELLTVLAIIVLKKT